MEPSAPQEVAKEGGEPKVWTVRAAGAWLPAAMSWHAVSCASAPPRLWPASVRGPAQRPRPRVQAEEVPNFTGAAECCRAQAAAPSPTVLETVWGTETIKMTALDRAQAAAPSRTVPQNVWGTETIEGRHSTQGTGRGAVTSSPKERRHQQ